jgi:hypothetical protein
MREQQKLAIASQNRRSSHFLLQKSMKQWAKNFETIHMSYSDITFTLGILFEGLAAPQHPKCAWD